MENTELKHILIAYKSTNIRLQQAHDEILALFDVSGSASDRPIGLDDDEWYCSNCKCVVPPHDVTNDERHGVDGCLAKVN